MSLQKIAENITPSDFETIETMASQNYAPSDIALALGFDKKSFMHIWRDQNSQIRQFYEKGRLDIELKKTEKLLEKIEEGSITAIQQHDKKSEERRFEDIKQTIFGL
ncbi:hypothetical protein [Abyssalbus ytuae]|uniref:Uncharacterized protein n=1 Tax=Abyssalbus ytuae TaxID=2926907 RepID=A0A9E6ZWP6_9FLAO|nr:hypothetical protein [Abyssalbus ytuae]UOB16582.1 hypothetical protein MQE35_12655 [Abyssalbus ytuae]